MNRRDTRDDLRTLTVIAGGQRPKANQERIRFLAFTREISKTLACEPTCEPTAQMSPCEPRWAAGPQAYATSLK